MANVAQLVEPRFVVPVVVGSSPIVRPIYLALLLAEFFYANNRALRFEPVLLRKGCKLRRTPNFVSGKNL